MLSRTKHLRALLLGAIMSAGLLTLTVVSPTAFAQTSKGTLTGIVRDSSGAVVPNADITITSAETGESRVVKTSSQGAYRLEAIPPGNYTLRAQTTGFERFEAKNVTVTPSQLVSFDVTLKPGHVDETVSVSATTVLLDQDNGSLSTTISEETLAKVPIFTLNPIEVATTVPGVQIVSNTGFENGEQIQVSGARPRANNFMIDGEEINDATIAGQAVQPQIPDMYSDVVVYTHNPPAEFGRASGGVVNLITKGGTNTYHGSAWDLYSGSGLNAVDGQTRQLVPKDRADKARFDTQQFGFTAGGAIIKNKLFGFGAAQYSRFYGNEQASQINLPNANGIALLQSLAAGSGTVATNAALMLKYLSNGSYLTSMEDFAGTTVFQSLGAACSPTDTVCAQGLPVDIFQRPPTPEQSPDTQWTYRIDYTPETKDTFTARYLHDRSSLTPDFFTNGGALPGFDTYQGGPSELGQGTWTHIFSAHLLNEFRASETRISFLFAPLAATIANPLYTLPTLEFNTVTPEIAPLGPNQGYPQGRGQDMYQWQDTVSWTHGRQSVRAGADIGRRIETDLNGLNLRGTLAFADGGSGSTAIGNFLLNQLGPSGAATIQIGSPRVDPHSWRTGVFAQDDIKVFPDFTINLGMRWDYFTNPDNSLPYPAIDPSSAATLYGPINTVYKVAENRHSFAPRIGFAYTPHLGNWFADGKTVIRGGFGIFFDPEFTNITTNSAANAPNISSPLAEQTTGNGLGNATGLIATLSPVVNPFSTVESVVNNLTTPYTPEWNLGIERELPGQIGISVTYVGSRGIKLFANQQYNYFDFNTGNRLNTTRGAIIARGNFADSDYNGLEVGVRHNFAHGVSINGEYVYSKDLDDGSDVFAPDSAPTSYSANLAPGGRGQDWANSTFDHRQYAAFTYVWSPSGLHADAAALNSFLSATTRHWTISGSSRFQTGAYSSVNFAGIDSNGDGSTANDRPLLSNKKMPMSAVGIDGIYLGATTAGTYYDLATLNATNAAVQVDPQSERWLIPYGPQFLHQEIGRDSYLNPGLLYNDVALEKTVPSSLLHLDRGQFVFRAEVQDFANHNNVNLPNVNLLYVGTASFLNPAEARETASRNLRFWMKYTF
jgi:hypothetical protein